MPVRAELTPVARSGTDMKYFSVSFYRNSWVDSTTSLILIAKNKTRAKKVTKEAFPNAIRIIVTKLETPVS